MDEAAASGPVIDQGWSTFATNSMGLMFDGAASVSHILEEAARAKVAVFGDVILDEIADGTAQRLSPEAPAPVLHVRRAECSPGGAAKVAAVCSALGATVTVHSVVGKDGAGDQLRHLLRSAAVNEEHLVQLDGWKTVRKLRARVGKQQLLRLDWEDDHACLPVGAGEELLLRLPDADVFIVSDYGKGALPPWFVRRVIAHAGAKRIPVLVDPHVGADYAVYRDASHLKPNAAELSAALRRTLDTSNRDDVTAACRRLIDLYGFSSVLATLDRLGMALVSKNAKLFVRSYARNIGDVVGAGDVVTAAFGVGIAVQAEPRQAAWIAAACAGLAVEKGSTNVTADQLRNFVLAPSMCKVLDVDQLRAECERWRARGERIVFTNGCYDIVHAGHVSLLERAAMLGERLIVGLNSDASVSRIKGIGRPVQCSSDRAALLASMAYVDAVVLFDDPSPLALIRQLRPDLLVKGADYERSDVVGGDFVESYGGEVVLLSLVPGRSTTAVINSILQAPGLALGESSGSKNAPHASG